MILYYTTLSANSYIYYTKFQISGQTPAQNFRWWCLSANPRILGTKIWEQLRVYARDSMSSVRVYLPLLWWRCFSQEAAIARANAQAEAAAQQATQLDVEQAETKRRRQREEEEAEALERFCRRSGGRPVTRQPSPSPPQPSPQPPIVTTAEAVDPMYL